MCACTLGIETLQSSPLSIQVKTVDTKTATPSRTSISLPTLLFPHHATLQYIPTSHSSILTQYCTYIHHVCMYLPTQSPPLPSSPIYFNRPRAGTIPLRPPTPSRFPQAGAKRPQPRPARAHPPPNHTPGSLFLQAAGRHAGANGPPSEMLAMHGTYVYMYGGCGGRVETKHQTQTFRNKRSD
jgi:hypothetical protein